MFIQEVIEVVKDVGKEVSEEVVIEEVKEKVIEVVKEVIEVVTEEAKDDVIEVVHMVQRDIIHEPVYMGVVYVDLDMTQKQMVMGVVIYGSGWYDKRKWRLCTSSYPDYELCVCFHYI